MILSGDLVEQDAQGPNRVGEAAITGGGELLARRVIHAASIALGGRITSRALQSSMDHAFRLAREHDVRTHDALIGGWSPEEVRCVLLGDAAR